MMPGTEPAADRDLLIGGPAIRAYVNTLVDPGSEVTLAAIYTWIEREHLPVKRIGARLIASKSIIRRRLSPV